MLNEAHTCPEKKMLLLVVCRHVLSDAIFGPANIAVSFIMIHCNKNINTVTLPFFCSTQVTRVRDSLDVGFNVTTHILFIL